MDAPVFPELFSPLWWLGALSAVLVGIAKTGVPGFGMMAVPIMVLAANHARFAAGWLLPLLCVADLCAVAIYRRHASWKSLARLFPWVAVGIAVGTAFLGLSDRSLRVLTGGIVLFMLALRVKSMIRRAPLDPDRVPGLLHAALYGTATGFSTTVANAAGSVMNLYLLGQRVPKENFMGIMAWFFLIINVVKLPIYGARDMIDRGSLWLNLTWLPALGVGALLGRAIFLHTPQKAFEATVLGLTAAATLLLLIR